MNVELTTEEIDVLIGAVESGLDDMAIDLAEDGPEIAAARRALAKLKAEREARP